MNKLLLIAFVCGVFGTAKAQDPILYSETWRLTAIQIDGILLDIPANSEVANIFLNITDVDPLPDIIETTVCNVLFGNVMVLTSPDRLIFTELAQTLISCSLAENTAFEVVYFDFFFSNEGLELDYEIIELLGQRSSDEDIQLTIYDSEGNKLIYGAGSSASVPDFTSSSVQVFPNPAHSILQWESTTQDPLRARVFSLDGKLLLETKTQSNQIEIGTLASGIYVLELSSAEGRAIQRFVKQ